MIVIFAGPGTNLLFAIVLFAILFLIGSGGYRLGFSMETDAPVVHDVRADHPAARSDCSPRTGSSPSTDTVVQDAEDSAAADREVGAATPVRSRSGETARSKRLGPARPRKEPQLSAAAAPPGSRCG